MHAFQFVGSDIAGRKVHHCVSQFGLMDTFQDGGQAGVALRVIRPGLMLVQLG
jgi:hypothetical protein